MVFSSKKIRRKICGGHAYLDHLSQELPRTAASAARFVERSLMQTGGFKDVDPTLLVSGRVGCYYSNTESVMGDKGEFKAYAKDPTAMYQHVLNMLERSPKYRIIVDLLAVKCKAIIDQERENAKRTLSAQEQDLLYFVASGGETRDWLFSMAVAARLGLPHVAIHKDLESRMDLHTPKGKTIQGDIIGQTTSSIHGHKIEHRLKGATAIHVVDLLTEGSSCYRKEEGKKHGWIPALRRKGVKINNLLAVVSRLEGGEQNLEEQKVKVDSLLQIEEGFLSRNSKKPTSAIAYRKDPVGYARKLLRTRSLDSIARFFNPAAGKLDRAVRFEQRHGDYLRQIGRWEELQSIVQKNYRCTLEEALAGGKPYDNNFAKKWQEVVRKKKSTLCVGEDPVDYMQATENTMPRKANKYKWCMNLIEKVAPYSAAIKINRNFVKDLSGKQIENLVDRIHELGMLAIADDKLVDIGNTNDSGVYHCWQQKFDAVTYSPFPGNMQEATAQAHIRGMGLIPLVLMSNPEYKEMKEATFSDGKGYEHFAKQVKAYAADAVVIGAPSPDNHITLKEVKRVRSIIGDKLVLMPGVGAQGGDAGRIISVFGDNVIANVGRAIMYAADPAKEARTYQRMLNRVRREYCGRAA